ncbi:MAG: hypothetical protein IPG31_11310 [Nitrosomonas sp.]|nr:hypothetical protein [Nitrosomonas sp.]
MAPFSQDLEPPQNPGRFKPVFYYDPTTIQKNDHFRKVWSLESGDNYDYDVRALFEFDCQKERVKILIYETAPSALHRPDRLTLRPLSPFDEREWVSLKRKMPDRPWHSFKQEKTLFNIVCDK